ncbi:helix-turn-helix domain-containing protein [Streptacidiphilus pinicola]|uniref:helix-turn-helix domain-containing protein n=1 Tax=Streptacidiphilus pinicola TaxID=2219663 RepID=UPI001A9CF537|nr:helix-turn-helix domain-containing protein [Streptacidiphilus pinicola]
MRTTDAGGLPAGAEPGGAAGLPNASQLRRLRQELERAWVRWGETAGGSVGGHGDGTAGVRSPGADTAETVDAGNAGLTGTRRAGGGRRRTGPWRPKPGSRTGLGAGPGSGPAAGTLRAEVVESWARSGASVDRACAEAPVSDADAARSRWADSQLRRPIGAVAEELRRITEDAGFVAAVTDETGTILWTCGGRHMRHAAERINFAPGGRWDEQAMGTNALSLALLRGQAATVFSAEHYLSALHGWVCYCAPIRHPDGRVLGVLDLSTTWERSHPLALSTVRLLAAGIEERLREDAAPQAPGRRARSHVAPHGRSRASSQGPEMDAQLRLAVLGDSPRLDRGSDEIPLRPRQLEILTLLALEPEGFTPERLHDALYGERPVSASTFKAEVSHLRSALGGGIATRRYALTRPVDCDAARVAAAVERGDTAAAVTAYAGPLLERSEAPGIVEWRDHLHVALREAVLASPDAALALAFGHHARYDIALHRHALALLAPDDARRGLATARLRASLS